MRKHVCDYCIARAVGTVCRHGRNPRGIMTCPLVTKAACIEKRQLWSEHDPAALKPVESFQGSTILAAHSSKWHDSQ